MSNNAALAEQHFSEMSSLLHCRAEFNHTIQYIERAVLHEILMDWVADVRPSSICNIIPGYVMQLPIDRKPFEWVNPN